MRQGGVCLLHGVQRHAAPHEDRAHRERAPPLARSQLARHVQAALRVRLRRSGARRGHGRDRKRAAHQVCALPRQKLAGQLVRIF